MHARAEALNQLPRRDSYARGDLLIPELLLGTEGKLAVYYAPFDYVSPAARVLLVGVTPGWTQMEAAVRSYLSVLGSGKSAAEAMQSVKPAAAFAGSLRNNLIRMLDGIGLADALGITTCAGLFDSQQHLLHPTSAVRYPVFAGSDNYSGHSPSLLKSKLLVSFVEGVLGTELAMMPDALIVPLGSAAGGAVRHLHDRGQLNLDRVLAGFPHPSGANPHRTKQFAEGRDRMRVDVARWVLNSV